MTYLNESELIDSINRRRFMQATGAAGVAAGLTGLSGRVGAQGEPVIEPTGTLTDGLNLPDPLRTEDGDPVESTEDWCGKRRPEVLELFREHVYGRAPVEQPADLEFAVSETTPESSPGSIIQKNVDISFSGPNGDGSMTVRLYIPKNTPTPVRSFLLINHRSPEFSEFLPVETIVERGYAIADFSVEDLAPDSHESYREGVINLFDEYTDADPWQRPGDEWKAIAAWAWGASRAMDYFETDPDISDVAVVGHSRGGKAALWAGARDNRFSLTVSNNSGSTGAALARNMQGERIHDINTDFPYWFANNYSRYNHAEEELPVDQHMLIGLIAPRLAYVASAELDDWADPEGEFLSTVHASPVYELFGEGVSYDTFPDPNTEFHDDRIGYHLREGEHDLWVEDWNRFMDYWDRHQ